MQFFSQKDPRWKNVKIWGTDYTIGGYGCYITSLAYLCGKTPPEVNQRLGEGGCIHNGMLTNPIRIAELLDLEYHGISITPPGGECIGETTYFAPKVPQHFVVVDNDKILDPLGKNIKYPIKTYRLYRRKDTMFNDDQARTLYRSIIGREPSKDDNWKNRQFDLVDDLYAEQQRTRILLYNNEYDALVTAKNSLETIVEANTRQIKELQDTNVAITASLDDLKLKLTDKEKEIEKLKTNNFKEMSFWQKISILF